jgi:hypothetical protein
LNEFGVANFYGTLTMSNKKILKSIDHALSLVVIHGDGIKVTKNFINLYRIMILAS